MKRRHMTSFYMETLLLIVLFIAVLLVLVLFFAQARSDSEQAGLLTSAVCLSQNAAEAVSAADGAETLAALLNEADNAWVDGNAVVARYDGDMTPNPLGALWLRVTCEEETTETGRMLTGQITVSDEDGTQLYSLETALYKEGSAA